MRKELTIEEWEEKFIPIFNTLLPPHKEDFDFLNKQDPHHIWTGSVSGDQLVVIEGYHLYSEVMYFITKNPWTEGEQYMIQNKLLEDD
ncbi:MAG: hypothetical protein U9O94_06165 [Nanoarchaeota archaeon]|nr:hypothetical protein [Nanoarchaeota archaeon]